MWEGAALVGLTVPWGLRSQKLYVLQTNTLFSYARGQWSRATQHAAAPDLKPSSPASQRAAFTQ